MASILHAARRTLISHRVTFNTPRTGCVPCGCPDRRVSPSKRVQASQGASKTSDEAFGWYAEIAGEYPLEDKQVQGLQKFADSMQSAAKALFAVAFCELALSVYQVNGDWTKALLGSSVGNTIMWQDSLIVAALVAYGASAFEAAINASCENRVPFLMQGLGRLSLVLQQFALASGAVGILTFLNAASMHPPVVRLAAMMCIATTGLRAATALFLSQRHPEAKGGVMPELISMAQEDEGSKIPLWERRLMKLVTGHLAGFMLPGPDQDFEEEQQGTQQQQGFQDKQPYRFNKREAQIMRVAMDTMHMAGMALVTQGFAIFLMGVAQLSTNNSSQILGTFSHGLNKSLTALLLFRASASFDVAFVGRGCNICNLVDGIQGGLTELFQRMTMLSWSVTVAQVVSLFLPQLGKLQVGNLALKELLVPQLTQVVVALQGG